MTLKEVEELIRLQLVGRDLTITNHRINLKQALVAPQKISVIARTVRDGRVTDRALDAWLVGQENSSLDGYKIIMRDDGLQFGLASKGFPADKHPILVGWYGDLVTTFLGM